MSLNVSEGTQFGLGEQAEQQVSSFWETLDSAEEMCRQLGFMPVERPVFAPPTIEPSWLDSLTPEQYHLLNAQLSSWRTYVQSKINQLVGGIMQCDNELDHLKAEVKKSLRTTATDHSGRAKKPSEEAIKDEMHTSPRCIEVTRRKQFYQQMKLTLEPHDERYGRDLRILSRALEMRGQELKYGGRGDPRGPHRGF